VDGTIVVVLDDMKIRVPELVFSKLNLERMNKGVVDYLNFPIILWVKSSREMELVVEEGPQHFPKGTKKT